MAEQLRYDSSGESLFIPADALRALRDSRYRSTAYALSELIDNSIDAKAKHIDILCFQQDEIVNVHHRWRLKEIAVLDDGRGMSRDTLIQALRFGGRESGGVRRIGKYGMGLPTSSVSKCRRADIWTWENSVDDAWHSYIDVAAIENNAIDSVPMPDEVAVPSTYLETCFDGTFNRAHGTLIVWNELDRVTERPETIFNHIEREIGKIHRYFINDGDVLIRAASFRENLSQAESERVIRPNDPLYLMHATSTPEPWASEPMFQQYGNPKRYQHSANGKEETIEVIYSIVKQEALTTPGYSNAGDSPHGQHSRRNLGVSIVRERREILLEDAFVRAGGASTNPLNRWWGCQVLVDQGSDDLLGVDHNKQMAATFTQAAKEVMNSDANDAAFSDDGDDLIMKIVLDIRNTTRAMLRDIAVMMEHSRMLPGKARKERVSNQAAVIAKEATKEAIHQGKDSTSSTDRDRTALPAEEREDLLVQVYVSEGQNENDARELAKQLVEDDEWYHFESDQLDAYQMFRVRNRAGVLRVILNMDHPIHDFIRIFEDQAKIDLSDPVRKAGLGIILMLMSWARMEDQIESDEERRRVQFIAQQWGQHVDEFIRHLTELA